MKKHGWPCREDRIFERRMSHENTSTLVQKMETAPLPPARGNSQCALVDALMQDLGGVWSGFCLNDTFNEKE